MRLLVRIGTRASPLAVAQARHVRNALQDRWPHLVFDLVPIVTEGDEGGARYPDEGPDFKRAFTHRLEEALLDDRIDLAVHSLKDLPVDLPAGLTLGGVPPREVPWDALVVRAGLRMHELPDDAVIGTSSLRRALQLRAARPRVRIKPLTGNVDTRLRKLDDRTYDAIVLAAAGLRRLGRGDRITHLFGPQEMVPAVGQGALALEVREGRNLGAALAESVQDATARAEVEAERGFARALGADCHAPVGAIARVENERLALEAMLSGPSGGATLRTSVSGPLADPADLGRQAAEELMARGGAKLLSGRALA